MSVLFDRPRAEVALGAVHIPGWLPIERQRDLVAACREWAKPPAGVRHTVMPSGGVMSVQTVCLGWHWVPYKYLPTADDVDGAPVKEFPDWLARLGREAVADAYGDQSVADAYQPDVALINFYDGQAKMGMHVDKDERSPAPVVSVSLGASCVFRFGNPESRNRPWHDIELASGDLFVFGRESRHAYHGVRRTLPETDRRDIGLPSGRLNITLRESGLSSPTPGPTDA
ncbi:MAG TPA: alpha-ketoglutarate-dependent dioxygenase AlkB [Streptosporangiaceae bacterium]|nr:alpha-ketoglutarate-dependent dioxygenase AlkB [Streptosporangiaceae bacterium]